MTKIVVDKEIVEEALTEILGSIPAFRALIKGKGPAKAGGMGESGGSPKRSIPPSPNDTNDCGNGNRERNNTGNSGNAGGESSSSMPQEGE